MLVRFEAKTPTKRCGIYNSLPGWFFRDYLYELEILPVPDIPILKRNKLAFFFTKEGFQKFGYALELLFEEPELIDAMDNMKITLFVAFLEEELIPEYYDEYQKAFDRESICKLEYKPIYTQDNWRKLEQIISVMN